MLSALDADLVQSNFQGESSSAAAAVVLRGWAKPAPRMTPGGHQGEQHGVTLPCSRPAAPRDRSHRCGTARHQLDILRTTCKTQGNPVWISNWNAYKFRVTHDV